MLWHEPEDLTLQRYLEGSLPQTERQAFSQHLTQCPTCQSDLQAARRLEQLTQSWKEVEPPFQLLAGLRTKLRPESWRRGWIWAVAAAALVGFVLGRGLLRPPQTAPQLGLSTPPAPSPTIPTRVGEQSPGRPLQAEQIWTTNESPSVVAFSGQILNLGPHTRLEVVSQKSNHYHLRLSAGQVRIQEHGEVISMETPHLRVDPLGTDYQVSLGLHSSRVYLYSGQVRVTGVSGQFSLLTSPGQSAQFPLPRSRQSQPPALTLAPPAPIPGPAYPQRPPSPHPQPQAPAELFAQPQPQPQVWRPLPENHRPPGGPPLRPWERPHPSEGRFRNTSAPPGKLGPQINRRPE